MKLWDIEHKKCLHTFTDHTDVVSSLKFHPDGTCLAAVSHDKKMKLWDARSLKIIQHYDASNSKINALDFHPSGYFIGTVSEDSQVKIWDIRQGRLIFTLYSHTGSCNDIKFSRAGSHFVTGGKDGLVMVWKTNFFNGTSNDNLILDGTGSSIGNEKNFELFSSNKQIIPNTGSNCSVIPDEDKYACLDNLAQASGTATGTFAGTGSISEMMEASRLEQGLTKASDLAEEGENEGVFNEGDVMAEYLSGKIQAIVEQMHHLTGVLQSLEERLERTEAQTEQLISSLSYKNDKSIRVESMVEKRNKSLMMSRSRIISEADQKAGGSSARALGAENPFISSRSKMEEYPPNQEKPIEEVDEEDDEPNQVIPKQHEMEEQNDKEAISNGPAAKSAELAEIEALMEQQKAYRNEIMSLRKTFEKFAQSSEEALAESKQQALIASLTKPAQPSQKDPDDEEDNTRFPEGAEAMQREFNYIPAEQNFGVFVSRGHREEHVGFQENLSGGIGFEGFDQQEENEVNVFREFALARSFKEKREEAANADAYREANE